MQATSDIFLGWHSSDLSDRDYYWRQLKDMKGSADVAGMDYDSFKTYAGVCAWCLAHAHARTGDEARIFGYIGKNDIFSEAISDFAIAYADQTEQDYQLLVEAVRSGRVPVEMGV
jgi:sugar/nucleoside kinase (ribokinase family)